MSLRRDVRLLFSITITYSNCIAVYFPFLGLYSLYKSSSCTCIIYIFQYTKTQVFLENTLY